MLEKGHKRKSFSLAEVLVTLTIIGVVAGMTIPPLVQSYQKQEYVTRLKKAYTTTNQALQQMATDMGCTGDLKCTGLFDSSYPGNSFLILGDSMASYINIAKNCKTNLNKGCWANTTNEYYDGTYTGPNSSFDGSGSYKFITSDGVAFYIDNYKNNCLTDGTNSTINASSGRTGHMKQTCGRIIIDINGLKPPNNFGRDTFIFFITNAKGPLLYPRGGLDDSYYGSDSWWINPADGKTPRKCIKTNRYGEYCTGRVIEEGWEMNY